MFLLYFIDYNVRVQTFFVFIQISLQYLKTDYVSNDNIKELVTSAIMN
jgi:hypothetical protein